MQTGRARGVQQTKQCVHSILCHYGRCHMIETNRPLKVRIMEHKYNLTQGLLEKTKPSPTCVGRRPQNVLEWSEDPADWTKHHIQEIQGIHPHVSAGPTDQSTQFGHLFYLDSRYHGRSKKVTTPYSVDWVGIFVFLCWYHAENLSLQWRLVSLQFSGARSHTYWVFNISRFAKSFLLLRDVTAYVTRSSAVHVRGIT
jgi:hypothetical protein